MMLCLGIHRNLRTGMYLTFDDLIFLFFGGDIRDEGEVCYM